SLSLSLSLFTITVLNLPTHAHETLYSSDTDECATPNRSALCRNICNNTLGGYICTCPRWYTEVGEDNCTAMDVCTELAVSCGGHSSCVNSPDSEEGYSCVCDSGYRQDGNSCSSAALVHIIWVITLVLATTTIFLIGCFFVARHKYLKNKRDIMKKYSVLFKYQIKKEEIDPSHNPVPFTPSRKFSYTFSVVSTLETYDCPLTPTLLEPDEISSIESSPDAIGHPLTGQVASLTDLESSKRQLSPIIEGNEDSASVEKNAKENDPNKNTDKHTGNNPTTVKGEVKKGYLNVEVTNPTIVVITGQESSTFSGYVQESESSCNFNSETKAGTECAEITKGRLEAANPGYITSSSEGVDGGSGAYVEDSGAFWDLPPTKAEVELLHSSPSVVDHEPEKEVESLSEKEQCSITEEHAASDTCPLHSGPTHDSLSEQKPCASPVTGDSVPLPHPPLGSISTSTAANDGYIPSNFSTTSSGYGSEEGNSSSFSLRSRFFSTYSYVPDSSTAYSISGSEGYVPSSVSTTSSGYYSSESSVCGSNPFHGHKVQQRLLLPDSYVDSVFCEEDSALCPDDGLSDTLHPSSSAACENRNEAGTNGGYVSYPTHEKLSLPHKTTAASSTLTESVGYDCDSLSSDCWDQVRTIKESPPNIPSTTFNPSPKDTHISTTNPLMSEGLLHGSNSGYIADSQLLLTTALPPSVYTDHQY
ncbi:Uromodulin, partial [Geodia barretti]